MEKGTIFKFHNDLDTDQIIASQYLLLPNLDEMKSHTFESLDPDFAKKVKPGDFVVGGEILVVDPPESRHRVCSKHLEYRLSLRNHLQESSIEMQSISDFQSLSVRSFRMR